MPAASLITRAGKAGLTIRGWPLGGLLLICCLSAGCFPRGKSSPVILKAGGRQWTAKEFEGVLSRRLPGAARVRPGAEALEDLKQSALEELIFEALAAEWAGRRGLKIPRPRISPEEQKAFQRRGAPLAALEAHKSRQALRQKLEEHLLTQIPDPPLKEQKSFYRKNKKAFYRPPACFLSQILVSSKGLGKSLLRRLREGEDFDRLAALYSEKGHPGWTEAGGLKVFDRACALEKGALSPLWESRHGFHILRAGARRPGRGRPFAEVQGQILKKLKEPAQREKFQAWLREETLKTPVFIDKKLLSRIRIRYKD